jgi:hypothetical protein
MRQSNNKLKINKSEFWRQSFATTMMTKHLQKKKKKKGIDTKNNNNNNNKRTFPEPVLAIATTSLPAINNGMA